MRYPGKHIVLVMVLLCCGALLQAQVLVRAQVEQDSIAIGQPATLVLQAYVPPGVRVDWPVVDTLPHFEIVAVQPVDTVEGIDGKKFTQEIVFTSFDSGRWILPAFSVVVGGQAYSTDTLPLRVGFVPFDPEADYRDIKEIIEVEDTALRWIPWVLALASLLAAAGIYYLLRERRTVRPAAPQAPPLTPYEEAVQGLLQLKTQPVAEGMEKNYYTAMNDILKKYVFRRFGIAAFERTNEELIKQLSELELPAGRYQALAASLRVADFVKFAKYRPSAEEQADHLGTIALTVDLLDKLPVKDIVQPHVKEKKETGAV